jgi:uncharacterized OB-fold protein
VSELQVSGRSAPTPDPDSADFWAGLTEGEIRLQRCGSCGVVRFPPLPYCPECGTEEFTSVVASGRGRVYAWITVRRPIGTITADEVPLHIATVELEEGPRLVGRLVDNDRPGIDAAVEARYFRHDDWTELRFAAAGGQND